MTAKQAVRERLLRDIVLIRGLPVDHVKNIYSSIFLILFQLIYLL